MDTGSRPIRPDDLDVFSRIPGLAAVARDSELRLFWCTESCYWVPIRAETTEQLMGTTLEDVLPDVSARERSLIQRRVMETGVAESHYQFSLDSRVLCTIFPLDEEAFGHRGIFGVVKDAPIFSRLGNAEGIGVLTTPNLVLLSTLTTRELEVLHFVAKGISTHEIALGLCRADKTVEHHINAIHGKIGTHSRAELVRFASERGIQSFTDEEWELIVAGARLIRKESVQIGIESD